MERKIQVTIKCSDTSCGYGPEEDDVCPYFHWKYFGCCCQCDIFGMINYRGDYPYNPMLLERDSQCLARERKS